MVQEKHRKILCCFESLHLYKLRILPTIPYILSFIISLLIAWIVFLVSFPNTDFYSPSYYLHSLPIPTIHPPKHHNATLYLFQPCFAKCSVEAKCTYLRNALGVGLTPNFVNGIEDELAQRYVETGKIMLLKKVMLKHLLEKINTLHDSDVVILADTDIFWVGSNLATKLITLYRKHYDGKLVFSSETNCYNGMNFNEADAKSWLIKNFGYKIDYYPYDDVENKLWYLHWLFCFHPLYPTSGINSTTHKFLNAGFFIASVEVLRSVLPAYFTFGEAHRFCGGDDQCLWHAYSIQEPRIYIDSKVEFILSAHGHRPRDFAIQNTSVYFPEADSYPFGVHTNGVSKQRYHMYEMLTGKYGHRFSLLENDDAPFYFDDQRRSFKKTCTNSTEI